MPNKNREANTLLLDQIYNAYAPKGFEVDGSIPAELTGIDPPLRGASRVAELMVKLDIDNKHMGALSALALLHILKDITTLKEIQELRELYAGEPSVAA
jgi:hypothetical protein